MLDETLLDDPATLRRRDTDAALLALALTGARVRTATRLAAEAGLADLAPEGRPRHILIAGQGIATVAAELLRALAGHACPITILRPSSIGDPDPGETAPVPGARWTLPGWVGPMDLLIVLTDSPTSAGLASLARQAYRRGSSIAVIADQHSALAAVAAELHAPLLPYAPPNPTESTAVPAPDPLDPALTPERPGTLWGLLTPLLLLADRLRLLAAPPDELAAVADQLDETATRCGPESPTYQNPAKSLAAQLDETLPLAWGDGPAAAVIAARFAAALTVHARVPALAGALPDALAAHRGLLEGRPDLGKDPAADDGAVPDDLADFFRDRVDEPDRLPPHVVLVRMGGREPGVAADDGRVAGRPADAARRLAEEHRVAVSEPEPVLLPPPPDAPVAQGAAPQPLRVAADLLATLEFTAVYLRLGALST